MNNLRKNITGLILAAGFSGRMKAFKPLLKINSETFISAIIRKLQSICNHIVIVTGYNSIAIEKELSNSELYKNIKIVINENYANGMFSSIQKGIEVVQSQWVIHHFVDQPSLPKEFYLEFYNQISDKYDWIQPINKGRKGHPIIFNQKVCRMILSKDINSSLRDISNDSSIIKYYWTCDNNLIFQDIDTMDDFKNVNK